MDGEVEHVYVHMPALARYDSDVMFLIGRKLLLFAALLLSPACFTAPAGAGRSLSHPAGVVERTVNSPPQAQADGRDESPKIYPVYRNGNIGFIDNTGKIVIPLRPQSFQVWGEFSDGMARIAVSTREQSRYCCRFGYINVEGRVVVEPQYWEAKDFSEGLAAVKVGDRWGYLDREGRTALGPKWVAAESFSEGLAAVYEESGEGGYIDKTGAWVIKGTPVLLLSKFSHGLAKTFIDLAGSKFGYIDRTGKLAVPGPYDKAEDFSEGLALVSVGGKAKFIDETGRVVIDLGDTLASSFSDGLARIWVGDKVGYMDRTGKVVIEPRYYEEAADFSEGLAAVNIKGRWGYVDKTGRLAIKPRFDVAGKFIGGIAPVLVGWVDADVPQTRARNGYIDKTGKYVWRPSK